MRIVKKIVIVLIVTAAAPHLLDISAEPISKSSLADIHKLQAED